MPYVLTKSNGRVYATIQDGSIDNTGSLTFIGKNYAGYGQIIQQDLLYILENFSSSTAPTNPIQGQIWFDSGNLKLKVYDGTAFKGISFTTVSNSQPTTAQEGDYWFNTANSTLSIKVGDAFTKISGTGGGASSSGAILTSVKDTDGNSHAILKTVVNSNDVSIFSYDSFAVNVTESIYTNFPYLKKGLTLVSTDGNGRTTASTNGPIMWGTAATALKADSLLVDSTSTFFSATTSTTANTVVARGASGDIWAANFFNSTGRIGQGYWGSRGYTGSGAGYTGSQGSAGSAGPIGPIGYTGSGGGGAGTGYTGSVGSIGPIGYTGSGGGGGGGGYTGSVGYTGSRGTIGYVGSKGDNASASPPVLYNVTSSPIDYTAGGAVFIQGTTPTALHVGDIWLNTTVTTQLLSSNGYTVLPGGLIMNWGVNTGANLIGDYSVTFSKAFTSSALNAQATSIAANPSGGTGSDAWAQIKTGTLATSGMTVSINADSGGKYAQGFYWFALGY